MHWAGLALVCVVWISAAIFGLYIVAFYFGAVFDGDPDQWNKALPRLYDPHTMLATLGMTFMMLELPPGFLGILDLGWQQDRRALADNEKGEAVWGVREYYPNYAKLPKS